MRYLVSFVLLIVFEPWLTCSFHTKIVACQNGITVNHGRASGAILLISTRLMLLSLIVMLRLHLVFIIFFIISFFVVVRCYAQFWENNLSRYGM